MERIPLNFIPDVPIVTKLWAGSILTMSLLIDTKVIKATDIIFAPNAIINKNQYWRLLTCFLYMGSFDLSLIMVLYAVTTYSKELEGSFEKTKDYLWFLLVNCSLLILYSSYVKNVYFLGPTLFDILTYIYSRRNPDLLVGILGLIQFRAGYVGFINIFHSVLLKGNEQFNILDEIPGILIGHSIFYFENVFPKLHNSYPLSPPWSWNWIRRLR